MGSWSVYCGISNITITVNTKVALIPLSKHKYQGYEHYSLPIFGVYDDYGNIKEIEKDFNTELIEKIHGCTIEEFCYCLTRRDIQSTNKTIEDTIKNIDYMWVNKDVYDYMASYQKYKDEEFFEKDELSSRRLITLGIDKTFILLKDILEEVGDRLSPIQKEYLLLNDDKDFITRMDDVVTFNINLYMGSYKLKPYILYITPQCGEHKHHQRLLKKFVEINKKCIYNY